MTTDTKQHDKAEQVISKPDAILKVKVIKISKSARDAISRGLKLGTEAARPSQS
jgi:hypothetical protein